MGLQMGAWYVPGVPRRRGTRRCGTVARSLASYLAPLPSSPPQLPHLPRPLLAVRGDRHHRLRVPSSGGELSHRALAGVLGVSRCQVSFLTRPHPPVPTLQIIRMRVHRPKMCFRCGGPWRYIHYTASVKPHIRISDRFPPRQRLPRKPRRRRRQHVGPSTGPPGDGREGQGVLA